MRAISILIVSILMCGSLFAQSGKSSSSSDDVGPCIADARWANTNGSLTFSKQTQTPISVSLLAHVSKGNSCANAEVRLTATYLTDTQEFICVGTISGAMTTSSEVQMFNLELRPFMQNDFLRWRNQPGIRGVQQGKRLNCTNLDASSEVTDVDRSRAAFIHIAISVLPSGGGLAVAEALIRINQ